jgi:hypothetical protein
MCFRLAGSDDEYTAHEDIVNNPGRVIIIPNKHLYKIKLQL